MVLLVVFVAAALGLYLYLIAFPKIAGMAEQTVVLEYGDLPVFDKSEVLIVRDETLFGAKSGGAVTYEQSEGTKVRKGVRLISVNAGVAAPTSAAIETVKSRAGSDMKLTGSYKAKSTAVVSYYSDGCEKLLTDSTIASVKRGDMESYPKEGVQLTRDAVGAGEPVYKLTDNSEWHMVYWVKASGDTRRYAPGSAVTVHMGGASVGAKVTSAEKEGAYLKVVLYSDMYYADLSRIRKINAEIVFAEYSGLIADIRCISYRDGEDGVYVKQRSGGYKWVPVKVLKQAGDKCTLAVGTYYDDAGKPVDTVDYYDVALLNPKEEGYD